MKERSKSDSLWVHTSSHPTAITLSRRQLSDGPSELGSTCIATSPALHAGRQGALKTQLKHPRTRASGSLHTPPGMAMALVLAPIDSRAALLGQR